MNLQINKAAPRIMHVDLNSCFASIEQQANPRLRDRPIAVAAYSTPNACVLAPSIEAKRFGIKVGNSVREARQKCPNIVILEPDSAKYRIIHKQFIKILMEYSSIVTPKSIDEAIVDFTDPALHSLDLELIGREIKYRLKNEIGECIRCNVGIATNRFLAKTAAGLHKPDGLDIITHNNLIETFTNMKLLDICGINVRYERRLHINGIYTPLEFFNTPLVTLHKQVFKSIVGYHWYLRLRGWETDSVDFAQKSIGHEYSLHKKTHDIKELSKILMKMSEKVGRRIRKSNLIAHGIYFRCGYTDGDEFHQTKTFAHSHIYASDDIFKHAYAIFKENFAVKPVRLFAVGCFNLEPQQPEQLELFNPKKQQVVRAMDEINNRYGEFIVSTARMMGTDKEAPDRIAFGKVKEIDYN
jgi:DNA polymerase-4